MKCAGPSPGRPNGRSAMRAKGVDRLIGARLLTGFQQNKKGIWKGRIFVPDYDLRVSGKIQPLDANRLKVSGCALGGHSLQDPGVDSAPTGRSSAPTSRARSSSRKLSEPFSPQITLSGRHETDSPEHCGGRGGAWSARVGVCPGPRGQMDEPQAQRDRQCRALRRCLLRHRQLGIGQESRER